MLIRLFLWSALVLLSLALTSCGGGSGQSGGSQPTLGAFVLTASAGDPNNTLIWTAPSVPTGAHLAGYDIKRSTDPNTAPNTVLTSVGAAVTTYTDSQVTVGTTYYYTVTARTDTGITMTSRTPPPLPSMVPTTGTTLDYSSSATPGGPGVFGLGDPAVCNNGPCQPPDPLFQSATYSLSTKPSAPAKTTFTLHLTLNRPAAPADLQSVQLEGALFSRADTPKFDNGITIPDPLTPADSRTIQFDSVKAGIVVPATYVPLINGAFYSMTASVADGGELKRMEITAPAKVFASGAGSNTQSAQISAPDNRQFTFNFAYSNTAGP